MTQIYNPDGGIESLVEDNTPQLGGNLDLNSNNITGTGNIDITGEITATTFIGNMRGATIFKAKAGEALTKGDPVYISGDDITGNQPVVSIADSDDSNKMPCFGLAAETVSINASVNVVTFGTLSGLDTSSFNQGDILYISTTGTLTATKPTGESSLIQNIGKVIRSHPSVGSIKVGGAGRTNDVPNLNDGNVFIGNASNQAETRALTLDDISETATNKHFTASDNTKLDGIAAGAEVNVQSDWNETDSGADSFIQNKPTTITSEEQTKLGHISVTQAVDLDTMESDVATNNAKVTNATHTGDVTGSGALTIANEAVTNAKMAHIATGTVKARTTAGTGDVEDIAIATTFKTALSLVKGDVGLSNVDNTSDENKPVSTATQTALDAKKDNFTENTAFNKNFGTASGTVAQGNDSRITDSFQKSTDTLDNITAGTTNVHFTTTDESKLDGIASGAEVNVNADWNAVSGDAQILNKPTDITDLSTHNVTELSDVTSAGSGEIITSAERTKLTGIAAGAEVNVQSNWTETDNTADSFIQNKPTTITSAEQTKLSHISVTQAVDLDTMESDITTNNSKVTNATHTGDVTGSTALTISNNAVTNAKLSDIATGTVKARTTAGSGDVEDIDIDTTFKTALNLDKSDVGLANVANVDTTNASNISSGTLNASRLPSNIDATKIANGTISNTEFQYLNGVTSNIQTQINNAGGISSVQDDTSPVLGGNLDANDKKIEAVDLLNFTNSPTASLTNIADVNYNSTYDTLELKNDTGEILVGQTNEIYVTNGTGGAFSAYQAVYKTSVSAGKIAVSTMIADGTIDATDYLGITTELIGKGGDGKVITFGRLDGINTSSYSAGDILYVSSSSYGGFTSTKPSGSNLAISTGIVLTSSSSGSIWVNANNIDINSSGGSSITVDSALSTTSTNPVENQAVTNEINTKQDNLTFGISDNNAVKINSADVTSGEYAKFTASGLESRSTSEVLGDLGIEAGAEVNVQANWNETDTNSDAFIQNKPTTITSAEQTKLSNITVSQAVNLDTMESDIATNNTKVTNATHTGDVTGSTVLTIADEAVTNAKMAHVATGTVKGRTSALSGDVEDLDIDTTLKTALNLDKSDVGLANVANVDTTNASNIASGTLAEARLPTNIDATKIANGTITNTEFQRLNGVTSDIQTQLNGKLTALEDDTNPYLGGNLNCDGYEIINPAMIDWDTDNPSPIGALGEMSYDTTYDTLRLYNDTGKIHYIGQNEDVLLNSSTAVTVGQCVSLNGVTVSGVAQYEKFIADGTKDAKDFVGLAITTIGSGNGKILRYGYLSGVNTSSFSVGDKLYPSASSAGNLTNTQPTGANVALCVATVVTSATSGTILVHANNIDLNVSGGGETNVQSNWTETDTNSDAFILNKPILASSATTDTTNASNISSGTLAEARLPSNIDATKIADGTITNTEFQRLNGVSSDIQTQINSKQDTITGSTNITLNELTTNSNIIANQDQDMSIILGRLRIDARSTDTYNLSHYDLTGLTQYQFSGNTTTAFVNGPTYIRLQSASDTIASVISDGIEFEQNNNYYLRNNYNFVNRKNNGNITPSSTDTIYYPVFPQSDNENSDLFSYTAPSSSQNTGFQLKKTGQYKITYTVNWNNASYNNRVNYWCDVVKHSSAVTPSITTCTGSHSFAYSRDDNFAKFATTTNTTIIDANGVNEYIKIRCRVAKNDNSFNDNFDGIRQQANGSIIIEYLGNF